MSRTIGSQEFEASATCQPSRDDSHPFGPLQAWGKACLVIQVLSAAFLGGKKKRQREAAASRDFIIARLEGNLKALDK